MGYTHYFRRKQQLPASRWWLFLQDCRKILDETKTRDVAVRHKVGPEGVSLNGVGSEAFEPFSLTRTGPTPWFCKTEHKPYDAAVCAVLLAAHHRFGNDIEITSDGDWEEWSVGADIYEKATGRKAEIPWPTWNCGRCKKPIGFNKVRIRAGRGGLVCYWCATEAERDEYYKTPPEKRP